MSTTKSPFTGWIAPASPGALLLLHRSGLSPHTPCQSPGALTRVAACTLARSPLRDPLSESFRHFVASMPAPVASGWSDSPGGACTHWKAPPCHGAPPTRSFAVDQLSRSITIGFNPFALWPSQYSTPGEGEESPRIATPFFPGGREMREFFRRRDPLPRDRRL